MRGRGDAKHEEILEFASPLSTDEGRAWLESQWDRYGIPDPPRTAKTGKLALGADELNAVAGVELAEDARDMRLRSEGAEVKRARDLLVAEAVRDEHEQRELVPAG